MKLENNLDTDRIRELVWKLAFPSMLAQFVSVLYSIVDRMYIGNIPEIGGQALAAVGVCGPVVTLITSFASWVGIGGAPIMSIRLGQKNEKAAQNVVANCFVLLTVMAAVLMTVMYLFKNQLLTVFGAGSAIFPYADEYLTWYLSGTAFALLSTGMNQFIICQGFAKVGMMTVLLGAVSNIILDPVFIFVLDLGVKGAAIATVLSQLASCVYVLFFLLGKRPLVRITFGGYQKELMARVLVLGLSPFLITASDSGLIIIMNMLIRHYGSYEMGDVLLTCNTIVQSFMLMITMPLGGITGGTQTILGYNYGAGRPDRIRKAQKHIIGLGMVFTAVMFVIAMTLSAQFAEIFTNDRFFIETSVRAIRISVLAIVPLAIQYEVVDGFTGMGAAALAISQSMFRKAVYLAAMLILPALAGIENVFYAEPAADVIASAVAVGVYFVFSGRVLGDGKRF